MSRILILILVCGAVLRAEKIPPIVVSAPGDESYIVLGDIQFMTRAAACDNVTLLCNTGDGGPGSTNLHHMFTWIINNITTYKIKGVISVGDVTDACTALEWVVSKTEWKRLIDAGLAVAIVAGNHDTCSYVTGFDDFMNTILNPGGVLNPIVVSRFGGNGYNSATKTLNGTHWANTAVQWRVAGQDILIIGVEWVLNPQTLDVPAWARNVESAWLAAHPGGHVWFVTHELDFTLWSAGANTAPRGSTWSWAPMSHTPLGGPVWSTFVDDASTRTEVAYSGHVTPQAHSYSVGRTFAKINGRKSWDHEIDFQGINGTRAGDASLTAGGDEIVYIMRLSQTGKLAGCAYSTLDLAYDVMNGTSSGNLPWSPAGSQVMGTTGAIDPATADIGYSCVKAQLPWTRHAGMFAGGK